MLRIEDAHHSLLVPVTQRILRVANTLQNKTLGVIRGDLRIIIITFIFACRLLYLTEVFENRHGLCFQVTVNASSKSTRSAKVFCRSCFQELAELRLRSIEAIQKQPYI